MRWLARLWKRAPRPMPPSADLRERIRASFNRAAADEEHFPSTIDPRIFHVKLVLEAIGDVAGGRVLDAGCGKGRFARIVKDRHPSARVVALDLAEAMLRFAARDLERCAGSLTSLPFPSGCFDAAYATESLEHAVEIETAVAELCRVLKPGGSLVIIDKNAEHWGELDTPAWERWFGREELEALLKKHCRQVSSRFISYWEDVEPDGLFLAWIARK